MLSLYLNPECGTVSFYIKDMIVNGSTLFIYCKNGIIIQSTAFTFPEDILSEYGYIYVDAWKHSTDKEWHKCNYYRSIG